MRRITGNEKIGLDFAQTWREHELDPKTRSLLGYAEKLTLKPAELTDADFDALRNAGWDEASIYHATALAAFYNFSGRMEAASGLPPDEIPAASFPEAAA